MEAGESARARRGIGVIQAGEVARGGRGVGAIQAGELARIGCGISSVEDGNRREVGAVSVWWRLGEGSMWAGESARARLE